MKWLFLPSYSQFSSNELGTESWWIDRKRSACSSLAAATRLTRLRLPSVTSSLVSGKPSAFNFSSIRRARRRLKTNSATLRALIAPSESAVCPTSRTIRNFEGSHAVATGFRRFKLAGPRAASFTLWGFGEAARLAEVACFGEATCAGDLLCL